jgi:hypothetical protein
VDKEKGIPKTLAMNFRGDIRDIATLVAIYEDRLGFRLASKSAIVRLALMDYTKVLARSLGVDVFENTEDAYKFLRQRNLIATKDARTTRMKKIIEENVLVEEGELSRDERALPVEVEELIKDPETAKRAEELKGGESG